MKVEFLVNTELGNGTQIIIDAAEFNKAEKNEDEFNSFAFATEAYFSRFGIDTFIREYEYKYIKRILSKNGSVIISVEQQGYSRRYEPCVYVSNNNRIKYIDLNAIDEE